MLWWVLGSRLTRRDAAKASCSVEGASIQPIPLYECIEQQLSDFCATIPQAWKNQGDEAVQHHGRERQ